MRPPPEPWGWEPARPATAWAPLSFHRRGTGSFRGTDPLSCVGGSPGAYNTVHNWNDGSSSTVRHTRTLDLKPGGQTVLTTVGTVISGVLVGDTAGRTTLAIATDLLDCLSPGGITSVSGPQVPLSSPSSDLPVLAADPRHLASSTHGRGGQRGGLLRR